MRYYCELSADTVNHVAPSVLMLDKQIRINDNNQPPKTILDLGCGNGRNSLYLAKKYNIENVILVDSDIGMLEWAQQLFCIQQLPVKTVCTTIEELASNKSKFNDKIGSSYSFDIVIFSYVVQHIDPVYYPLVFDFCRQVSARYMAIDVFWNPARLSPGDFIKIGSVNWYGLTYEELATLVAPRFHILNDKVVKTDISVVINMALKDGQTPIQNILERNYEYYSERIRRYNYGGKKKTITDRVKAMNIEELQCVKLLSSLYPTEFDFVKTELTQWIQNSSRIALPLMAAKFLWLCRSNKIPIMLNEVSRDFEVSIRGIMQRIMLSDANYIPSLGTEDYIRRIAKQFSLSSDIEEHAMDIVKESMFDSTTPVVRACCAVIKAAELIGILINKAKLAYAFDITTVGINLALKRRRKYHDDN